MKKYLILLGFLTYLSVAYAQTEMVGERKFQILVKNDTSLAVIQKNNQELQRLRNGKKGIEERGLLSSLLKTGYGSLFVQKSANASANLLNLGLSYLIATIKGNRERWYQAAKEQCTFVQPLVSKDVIDDFYALPSTKGALDPEYLKFEGFGCRNYIELKDQPDYGCEVFYVFCKLRQDSVGLNHIVNHSKFMVDLDTLMFAPKYCNLPNDSTGRIESRFDFNKRKNLRLTLKARIYSSWINEAIMVTQDQQLGEFTIQVKIDKNQLNEDGVFIYSKTNPEQKELVTVSGDCFIVPRSFTGTTDFKKYQPVWGTGQYRIEMDVIETCEMIDEYYQIPIPQAGPSSEITQMASTKNRKWDKTKWQPEWNIMKSRKKSDSLLKNVWKSIEVAYKGDSWITTMTSPLVTALTSYETQKLNHWFDIKTTEKKESK